jgi:hypothetical protein
MANSKLNMHTGTGMLVAPEYFNTLPEQENNEYVEVKRDLTIKEKADMQIRLYAPCGCGSGKKFKFCCFKNNKSK